MPGPHYEAHETEQQERMRRLHGAELASFCRLEFGFGFVQYFIHPNRRTVHDRIAETVVVAEGCESARRGAKIEDGGGCR